MFFGEKRKLWTMSAYCKKFSDCFYCYEIYLWISQYCNFRFAKLNGGINQKQDISRAFISYLKSSKNIIYLISFQTFLLSQIYFFLLWVNIIFYCSFFLIALKNWIYDASIILFVDLPSLRNENDIKVEHDSTRFPQKDTLPLCQSTVVRWVTHFTLQSLKKGNVTFQQPVTETWVLILKTACTLKLILQKILHKQFFSTT